ncbi:hypothetical protein A1O3_00284 [Capronia epimyces CBS 606.96]|uniref:RWD domain-containing protein n=1 Tax=Capronia epimyces CBS 606.96 TaxID=1182542 RepID=W9ZB22_9EURO|nr:uncharacterized protein A1O3_00284 [Capronia epimyces CBS 606.96]EXJ91734.1 hypothetical protein A1O3_00284 [Capronia epimyces CBS 606.96]
MPSDDGAVSSNAALADELEALNSIYEAETLVLQHDSSSEATAVLRLPDLPFSFLVTFPSDYPDVPPAIIGTQSTGGSGRGEGEAAVTVLRDVLAQVWTLGQVCLFDLVEEAGPILQQQHEQHHSERQHPDPDFNHGAAQNHSQDAPSRSASSPSQHKSHDSGLTLIPDAASSNVPPPAWTLSEPLTVNKSTFIARACPVSSLPEVMDSISHLLATNKKVATATHNITAWRIQGGAANATVNANPNSQKVNNATPNSQKVNAATTIQDCDDDGETAAGGRVLHLMQLMDVWNVLVVVTRWYGGVKLGPDRFHAISSVAREALVKGGFVKEEGKKAKGKGKGKK